jgi:hypothetical protein
MSTPDSLGESRDNRPTPAAPAASTFGLRSTSKIRDLHLNRLAMVYVRHPACDRRVIVRDHSLSAHGHTQPLIPVILTFSVTVVTVPSRPFDLVGTDPLLPLLAPPSHRQRLHRTVTTVTEDPSPMPPSS